MKLLKVEPYIAEYIDIDLGYETKSFIRSEKDGWCVFTCNSDVRVRQAREYEALYNKYMLENLDNILRYVKLTKDEIECILNIVKSSCTDREDLVCKLEGVLGE